MRAELHDGRVLEFPDGTDPAVIQATVKKLLGQQAEPPKPEDSRPPLQRFLQDGAAGALRGAGSIGATLLSPLDQMTGRTGRREDMTSALGMLGADTDSFAFGAGKLGTEIAGTGGVGGLLAKLPLLSKFPALAEALRTAGMTAGGGGMAARVAGGAATGGASAALVDPSMAGTGAAVGAALPGVTRLAGMTGAALGKTPADNGLTEAIRQARGAGYVIPPTQAKPSMLNRGLESLAGKISTAQNASAKNAPVTNALAKAGIGADDLTPEGLAAVRSKANAAYDQLAQVGEFQADDTFRTAVQQAGGSKALPGIANKEVDSLVEALSGQSSLDAQQTIESIKRLRFDGGMNRGAPDPSKRALGSAQMKIAAALEDVIDRNLRTSGQHELLTNYRTARQTLAKVYDVEKALNTTTGNVDAQKLAALLKKGRPLTGELRTIADFANRFPKAAQPVERMGSLPQSSPLDWVASGAMSVATQNPLMMAGVLARPAARSAALSPLVQNSLTKAERQALKKLLASPDLQQAVFRSGPLLASDQ